MPVRSGRPAAVPPRRGVTLVLVSITIFILIGFAALAVDVARLTHYKSELKGIADAAAMSAALDLAAAQSQAVATSNVSTLVSRNAIGNAATATVVEVTPVTWSFTTNTVTATPVWNAANAVRVVTRHSMNWILAQLLQLGTGRTLQDTSIAAFGQRTSHSCLRPFVFPYSALRKRLGITPWTDTTSLTAANIFTMRGLTTTTSYTVLDTVNTADTLSFGWANTRQGSAGAAADIVAALSSCVSGTLGAGSSLQAVPALKSDASVLAQASTLCGSATTCSSNNQILVPIYTSGTNIGTGGTTTTTTNQTYDFTLTAVSNGCLVGLDRTGSNFFSLSQCSNEVARLPAVPATFSSGNSTFTCTGTRTVQSYSRSAATVVVRYASCTVSTTTGGTGRAASTYVIKYIATFVWTARTNTTVTGYFTTVNLPPAGTNTWSNLPGPITSAVLVR